MQTVEILAVYRWYEFASCEAREHSRRKVMLANSFAKLKVLMKHGAKCKGHGLYTVSFIWVRGRVTKRVPSDICTMSVAELEK